MRTEYQDLVDEVSALLGTPATLESRDFGLLAYGVHDSEDDPQHSPRTAQGGDPEDPADDDRTVRPAHRGEVTETAGAHVVVQLDRHRPGIPHGKAGK